MSLLFETISIRDGVAENLPWHQERIEASIRALFGRGTDFSLAEIIRIPHYARHGHFRCRIDYDTDICKIDFQPYVPKEINTLRIIEDNDIEYSFKYNKRDRIDELFGMRGTADDIMIVKHGLIMDSSVANFIFYDGHRWMTPSTPLLGGTCRARLLDLGFIHEARIKITDLSLFREVKLINALRKPEHSVAIPVKNITT
jgi:4-amino-4-deoxychorismate lyase